MTTSKDNSFIVGFVSKNGNYQVEIFNNPDEGAFRYIYKIIDADKTTKLITNKAVKQMVKNKQISEFALKFC